MDKFTEWEMTRPALAMAGETDEHKASAERMAATMSGGATSTAASTPASSSAPNADRAQPAPESAKQHGTVDLPPAHSQSNTDSGLGTPESSSPRPVHEAGPDAQPSGPTNGPTVRAWEGSRNATDASNLDAGGNVR
jgi:hypothetical protein